MIIIKNGIKIGLFALGEKEWIKNIRDIPNNELDQMYQDPIECAKEIT